MEANTDALLVHNCLNEVLNGLGPSAPVRLLLERKAEIEQLFTEWRTGNRAELLCHNRPLIADVVDVVRIELGEDEFETRAGAPLALATAFVKQLRDHGSMTENNRTTR